MKDQMILNIKREKERDMRYYNTIHYEYLLEAMVKSNKWCPLVSMDNEVCVPQHEQTFIQSIHLFNADRDSPERLTIDQCFTASALISGAGAMRYLLKTLKIADDDSQFTTPISQRNGWFLGSCLRQSPLQMPIRTYDGIPLFLRGCDFQLWLLTTGSSRVP
jgi:hypothetical protein